KGQVLDARAEGFGDETPSQRAVAFGPVESEAQRAFFVLNDLAADETGRIDDIDHRAFLGHKDRAIEQDPGQHFLVVHGLRHMVDAFEARIHSGQRVLDGLELYVPDPAERAFFVQEIDHATANATDGRYAELVGADAL